MSTDTVLAPSHTDRSVRKDVPSALGRSAILVYGIAAYILGVAALLAMILIMVGAWAFTGGPVPIESPALAALFNGGLFLAFALQHSVMARASFKERWVRIVHPAVERSTYMLATSIVLLLLLVLWQPLPTVLWSVKGALARGALMSIAVLAWTYLFVASFAINHFELFGLQQSWRGFRGQPPAPVPFRVRWMYRFDRHPIMTGILVGVWVTPDMTVGRLLFAATCSIYVVFGVYFEERALRRQWGSAYEEYRRRTFTLVPFR